MTRLNWEEREQKVAAATKPQPQAAPVQQKDHTCQKGWILLRWGKEITFSSDLLDLLKDRCPSAGGMKTARRASWSDDNLERWESLFCCGEAWCPHCSGDVFRGFKSMNLMTTFPAGIVVPVRELLGDIQ